MAYTLQDDIHMCVFPPQGLPPCRSTCCGWGGLRALMNPTAMLAGA